MITNSERHFIEQWREQRSGPKWQYYLLFTLAWGVVSFLIIFFLAKLFTNLWETGGSGLIYIFIALALVSGFLSTNITYVSSEKRYKKIMKRENIQAN
ncbi:MAG: hypothetical protein ABI359_05080 [Ginsengibacter sp.]